MLITRCHSPISHRGITLIFIVATVFLLTLLAKREHNKGTRQYELPFDLGIAISAQDGFHAVKPCASELDYLRRKEYGLTRNIIFRKRCFRGVYSPDANLRNSVSEVESPLLGSRVDILDLDDQCRKVSSSYSPDQTASCEPITLQVAEPFPVADFSKVIFGVATTLSRLKDSIPQFSHWMSGTGAIFLAIVVDESVADDDLDSLESMYNSHDISLTAIRPWNCSFDVNEQHFAIIRDLVDYSTHETQWAVIIDDDTFFPSPYSITQLLAAHDPTVPTYIGGLSESPGAVEYFGFMAYGGAGIFMSMPLLQQLDSHVDDCLAESLTREGDGLLNNCIRNYTQTELTAIPGLHQLDMRGDLSGFYESGALPLSLHHWKSWHQAPVDKMAKIADFCGDCFLQRWRFDGNSVLANGYSISVYEDGISQADLGLIEGTWEAAMGYEGTMGKMRDKLEGTKKKSYRLIDAEEVDGNLRQVFVHHGASDLDYDGEEEAMDEVVEIWWEWTRE
ncbi:glycosyltransferase family 31 protein [Trichoderma virens Gv29-8]|uniref:Glycosyltransferase family 31 protein n=1 Tax=Hypocrea virens (strain Gv29-8 / FGSC 10586) TaxID=413071 RepID=G9N510_HYPVG|nr:glycosyltransferase family 31 protein [Trichoderma virens Gv29-8]EHK17856.1 glycosyltransferase family 31 protein [Trichoderma virens Gv29-8]